MRRGFEGDNVFFTRCGRRQATRFIMGSKTGLKCGGGKCVEENYGQNESHSKSIPLCPMKLGLGDRLYYLS
jgi:hypothetical protein